MQARFVRNLVGIVSVLAFGIVSRPVFADTTDLVREMAKNKPKVLILTSGPQANSFAEALENAVRRHPESKHHSAENMKVLPVAQVDSVMKEMEPSKTTAVLFLVGKEMKDATLPASVRAYLPYDFDPNQTLGGRISVIKVGKRKDKPGEPIYLTVLYAPDKERLARLYARFVERQTDNFRDLPFEERYQSNRLLVFTTPENQALVKNWGAEGNMFTWNDIIWKPLEERDALSAADLEERKQVYFIDRSQEDAPVPAVVEALMATRTVAENTVLTARGNNNGEPIVVVSAPSRLLLQARTVMYRDFTRLQSAPVSEDVVDMRAVTSAPLLIMSTAVKIAPERKESLHNLLSNALREKASLSIEPRSLTLAKIEDEISLSDLRSGARGVRQKIDRKYVFVFQLDQYAGSSLYKPSERKLTPDLGAFTATMPEKPHRGDDESSDDFEKRYDKYRAALRKYQDDKQTWEDRYRNEDCQWECSITRTSNGEVHGMLQLIELTGNSGAKVLWETESRSTTDETKVIRSEQVTLQGHARKPSSLPTPQAEESAPESLMQTASRQAVANSVIALTEEAWLPDEHKATTVPVVKVPKIADILNGTVVLNVGTADGVKRGELMVVPLMTKNVTDPDTGKVIAIRVLEQITLKVTVIEGKSCDCIPATPQDKAKLAKLKPGMVVQRSVK